VTGEDQDDNTRILSRRGSITSLRNHWRGENTRDTSVHRERGVGTTEEENTAHGARRLGVGI